MSLRLSACIEMIFRDLPVIERLRAVAASGLSAYEFWQLDGKDVDAMRREQESLGIRCAAFAGTARVPLVDQSRRAEYLAANRVALEAAATLGCGVLLVTVGNTLPGVDRSAQHAAVVGALKEAAKPAQDAGVTLALEPLNVKVNHAGYFLDRSDEGFAIVEEVGSPSVKLLYDVYHQQITEGNLIPTLTAHLAMIGHIHVADNPGRHEPGTGEINYRNVFRALANAGYEGFVGLEFHPLDDHAAALASVRTLL